LSPLSRSASGYRLKPRAGRALALLTLVCGAILAPLPAPLADVIHMKNGSTVSVDQWWEQGGEIRYRRAGGIIGIPKSQVERIEATPRSAPAPPRRSRLEPPPGAAAAPLPERGAASFAPMAPVGKPSQIGPAPIGNDPASWRTRLKLLEPAVGRPGVNEGAARREAAILHTLLGNEAARSGDLEGAEASYRLAIDKDPNLPAPFFNLSRVRMTQGRDDDAERLIENALAIAPEDPTGLALMGEVCYRTDRLADAIDLWERSLKKEPDATLQTKLGKARRQLDAEQDFFRSDAPHFTLKYDGDRASQALSREILDHLEAQFAELTSRYNVYPASVIIVTLYSREDFRDVTQSPDWVGGLFDGQIRIPIGGLTRLTDEARSVFTHELTHCVVFHKTRGNCPKWLQEGIAQWQEGKSGRHDQRDLVKKYASATPADLEAEFSYPLSLSLIERFMRVYSLSQLLDLLEALGRGSDIDSAFQSATGQGLGEFEAAWIRDLPSNGGGS
jgi:tetratricopeptide (TPR) repeat protein